MAKHRATKKSTRRAKLIIGTALAGLALTSVPQSQAISDAPRATGDTPGAHSIAKTPTCTGALIDPSWILTSDHCRLNNGDTIKFGPNAVIPNAIAKIIRTVSHPGNVDLKLGELDRKVNKVKPAKLYNEDKSPEIGATTHQYGFGDSPWHATYSEGEFDGRSYTVTRRSDGHVYREGQFVGNRLKEPAKSTFGDSGGPMFVGDKLYGAHTHTHERGKGSEHSYHVGVSMGIDNDTSKKWINDTVGKDLFSKEHHQAIDNWTPGGNRPAPQPPAPEPQPQPIPDPVPNPVPQPEPAPAPAPSPPAGAGS